MGSMKVRSWILVCRTVVLVLMVVSAWSFAAAGDTEKKFRLGLAIGGLNAQDEILSEAGHVHTFVDEDELRVGRYFDPRNENAVFGRLEIQPGYIATLSGQYGFNRWFILEGSVGYQLTDVGDVEVQAQTPVAPPENTQLERYNFLIRRITAGELTRIPIQLTAIAHFRPHANFDPYAGIGIGYTVIGFEPYDEFNQLSINMDSSRGAQQRLTFIEYGSESGIADWGDNEDLIGAHVDARDTFEWHLAGGAEYSFKRKWSAFVELRYSFASRELSIGFNGSDSLGISVPQYVEYYTPEAGELIYGPVEVTNGGLIDWGQFIPEEGAPPETDCSDPNQRENCRYDPTPDGELEIGYYYVQGGSVKYDAVSLQFGFRYAF
jgi:outer membrane protein W